MTFAERIQQTVGALPPDKQREVLDFAEFLCLRDARRPRQVLEGLWADLHVDISEEDIDEARREMWGEFPRSDGSPCHGVGER